jgi:SsrA-binding protein
MDNERARRIITSNRKARHNYDILETFETGIVLTGTEVKSLRNGNANVQNSYAIIKNGELWLLDMHISPFSHGGIYNHDPLRERKLLVHKKQLRKLFAKTQEKGLTLIPLLVYFDGSFVKIELGVARGKRSFDKRESITKREANRELQKRFRRS